MDGPFVSYLFNAKNITPIFVEYGVESQFSAIGGNVVVKGIGLARLALIFFEKMKASSASNSVYQGN